MTKCDFSYKFAFWVMTVFSLFFIGQLITFNTVRANEDSRIEAKLKDDSQNIKDSLYKELKEREKCIGDHLATISDKLQTVSEDVAVIKNTLKYIKI